ASPSRAAVPAARPGTGTPTGSATFWDGAAALGTPVTIDATGRAVLTTTALAAGQHTITAVYSGDDNFLTSSSASLVQQVNQGASSTTLVSSLNPTTFGQPFILTA